MRIGSFSNVAEKYFSTPLPDADKSPNRIVLFFKNFLPNLQAFGLVCKQKILRDDNAKTFKALGDNYAKEKQFPMYGVGKCKRTNDRFFEEVAQKRFKEIFRKSAVEFVKKKIQSGEWGDDKILSLRTLHSKAQTWEAALERLSFNDLVSCFSATERQEIIETCCVREWNEYFRTMDRSFLVQATRLNEVCFQHFLNLFSPEERQSEHAWKIPLALRVSEIKSEDLPEFYRQRFSELMEGLPKDYEKKAALWREKQKEVVQAMELRYASMQKRIGKGFDLIELMGKHLPYLRVAADNCETSNQLCVLPRCAEQMKGYPQYGADLFTHNAIEALIVRDVWKRLQGKIEEQDLADAFQEWGKFSLEPDELEELSYRTVLMRNWHVMKGPLPDEQFDILFKKWKKQENKSEESFRDLLVEAQWQVQSAAAG
jgi:hypothetical protein